MKIKNPSCITDILRLTNYRSSPPQTPEVSLQFHKSFFFLQPWNFCVGRELEKKTNLDLLKMVGKNDTYSPNEGFNGDGSHGRK